MPYNSTLRHAVSVGQTITSTEDNYKAHVNLQENACNLLVLVSENHKVATPPEKSKNIMKVSHKKGIKRSHKHSL